MVYLGTTATLYMYPVSCVGHSVVSESVCSVVHMPALFMECGIVLEQDKTSSSLMASFGVQIFSEQNIF